MKNHAEDEKLQSAEGVWFGSGKQGLKNTTISTRATNQTLQENFSRNVPEDSTKSGSIRQCAIQKWIRHNNLPTRREASEAWSTSVGGWTYGTWKAGIGVQDGWTYEDWKTTRRQPMQSIYGPDVTMCLYYQELNRKYKRISQATEETGLARATKFYKKTSIHGKNEQFWCKTQQGNFPTQSDESAPGKILVHTRFQGPIPSNEEGMRRTRTMIRQMWEQFEGNAQEENMTNPTDAQLNKAMDKIEEELHAIIFMYKADRHKYGNILDQMENDVLQKKTLSQKL